MKSISQYSTTIQEYVEIIFDLQQKNQVARIKDIARMRGVTPSTVTSAIRKLKKQELVYHQKFGFVGLTPQGQALGEGLNRRQRLVQFFLVKVLGVDPEVAENDACAIEHVITMETTDKLLTFIDFVEKCPRGGPLWLDHYKQCQEYGKGHLPCESCPYLIE
jgi:DtxR family Mn-dependent transcriptional regulator